MPPEKSFELMKNRENKFTHESKKDIHERDKKHIIDMCSTNIPHDDYFTVTKQQLLESLDNMILQIVQYFISGSMLIDFFSIITARVESICNYYNINYNELEFENDEFYQVLENAKNAKEIMDYISK